MYWWSRVLADHRQQAAVKDRRQAERQVVSMSSLGDDMTDAALSGTTADSPEGIL